MTRSVPGIDQPRRTPVDLDHLARGAVGDADVIAQFERAVEVQRQADEQVDDQILQRQADHDAYCATGGEEGGDGIAEYHADNAGDREGEQQNADQVALQAGHANPLVQLVPDEDVDHPVQRVGRRQPQHGAKDVRNDRHVDADRLAGQVLQHQAVVEGDADAHCHYQQRLPHGAEQGFHWRQPCIGPARARAEKRYATFT